MRAYLCGPINGETDSCANDWREWFCSYESANESYVNPMRRDYRGLESGNYKEIVEIDKLEIRNSDAIVVMHTKPSVGTAMEVMYASVLGKPIVTINSQDGSISPWLIYHSTAIVSSKLEARMKLLDWFGIRS